MVIYPSSKMPSVAARESCHPVQLRMKALLVIACVCGVVLVRNWQQQQQGPGELWGDAVHSDKKQHQIVPVRCFWGANMSEEEARVDSVLPFAECSPSICASSQSHEAYSQFLFQQAVSTVRQAGVQSGTSKPIVTTIDRFLASPTQCLFLPSSLGDSADMCQCKYSTFLDYCEELFFNPDVAVTFTGDSTTGHFQKAVAAACQSQGGTTTQPNTTAVAKHDTVYRVHVFQDGTLHRLYLPFSRESDVPMKGKAYDKQLSTPPTSVAHYLDMLKDKLDSFVASRDPESVFVYMANNQVCHDPYTEGYKRAEQFLLNPDPAVMSEIQSRRSVDETATWGFTLDSQGSKFAQRISLTHVASRQNPPFVIFPLAATYPGNCEITHDGRHFTFPEDTNRQLNFYIAKARMLHQLVQHQLEAHT